MPASLFAVLGTVQFYRGKAFVVLRSSEMCGKCLISAYTKMPASSDDLNLCSYLSSGTVNSSSGLLAGKDSTGVLCMHNSSKQHSDRQKTGSPLRKYGHSVPSVWI